ncbi:nitroreductase family protein [Candidatus Pacearchaeota archaeon]|nr:nitroreductase family protein [Candidatus Pacearchaeota archaeon]
MDFDKVIRERRSIRKFKKKRPDWRDILEAIEAARQAPSAGNLHAVKFILVDNPEIIADLSEAADQDFILDAHYVVVVCSDAVHVKRAYYERGDKYLRQQSGAAIENFLLKLTDLGLGGCWVGAFVDDHVKRILHIPENVSVEAIIPVGYSADISKRSKKPDQDSFFFFNKYKNKFLKPRRVVEER